MVSFAIEKQILWLQVSMNDPIFVEMLDSQQDLMKEFASLSIINSIVSDNKVE